MPENKLLAAVIIILLCALKSQTVIPGLFFGSLNALFRVSCQQLSRHPVDMVLYTMLGRDLDFFSPPVILSAAAEAAGIAAAWTVLRVRRRKRREGPVSTGGSHGPPRP